MRNTSFSLMIAWTAGMFALLVGTTLLIGHLSIKADDPLNSLQFKEYKEKLRVNPGDETLKNRVRQLDLQLRERYFRHLTREASGVDLMLGSLVIFVAAITQVRRSQKQLPMPESKGDEPEKMSHISTLARWYVAVCGLAIGTLLFILSLATTPALPKRVVEVDRLLGLDGALTPIGDFAQTEELKQNWPRFRGAEGSGASVFTKTLASWDPKTGTGVAWKIPAPATGFNSPIVWSNRVFFSGANKRERTVFCLEVRTGKMLWQQSAPGSPTTSATEVPEFTGYAAPSMATDGHHVYAIFGNGDLVAFTLEGKLAWSKSFGPLKNMYGHASSLAVWRDRLLVLLDQGESEEGRSKLYALDGRSGQIVWQRQRKVGSSWATPIVIEAADKAQVIALAVPWVISYAVGDGAELWRVECLSGEITPSPIFANELLYVISPSEKLLAIRTDGSGDVTKTRVAWTEENNVPDITCPTSNGELLFTLASPGMLTCFDCRDGKKQWEHDFEMEFHSSPSLAGGRLYLFSLKGTALVVDVARQFKEISRIEMADVFHASPAFAQNRIILRGETNVWCFGAATEELVKR